MPGIPYEYARSALQIGLKLKDTLGVNPFKFGVIGSTDAHTGLASADDNNFWGKTLRGEPSPKETYATTGPRMRVRAFAGYDFEPGDLQKENLVQIGYAKGVPMGGDLARSEHRAPVFLLMAGKDTMGANLDRIQVIKGWIDAGARRENIYNAVVSEGRVISATGKVAPVDYAGACLYLCILVFALNQLALHGRSFVLL